MTENADRFAPAAGILPAGGDFTIRKIYVKDISFETPNSPAIFRQEWKPDADVQISTASRQLGPGEFEVALTVTVTVSVHEKVAFVAEVQHAGAFGITGITSTELAPVLGIICPTILFPYTRETISDLVVRGGFPQLVLAPVNFEALYAKRAAGQDADRPADAKSAP